MQMPPDEQPPASAESPATAAVNEKDPSQAASTEGTAQPRLNSCVTRMLIIITVIFCSLLLIMVAGFISMFPHTTHSLGSYPKLRARWKQQLVSHFPQEIPADATLKKFSHFPGFLQGGGHIQLRLQLPPSRIQALHAGFSQKCIRSFWWDDVTYGYRSTDDYQGSPETSLRTGDSGSREFPSDYEIMILDPYRPPEGMKNYFRNHGSSYGVAISLKRHEIVYWAESW